MTLQNVGKYASLISSGAVSADDHPELDQEEDTQTESEKTDNLHIELNDKKPDFLKGVKVTKDFPDTTPIPVNQLGPLTKSAQRGSKFARDFKEEKFKQKSKGKRRKIQSELSDPLFQTSEPVKNSDLDPDTESFISNGRNQTRPKRLGNGQVFNTGTATHVARMPCDHNYLRLYAITSL